MSTTLTHVPTARSITIERNADIGNTYRRSMEQDSIISDSGKENINTRKVPITFMDISFRNLSQREEARLAAFVRNVLKESKELFTLTTVPIMSEPWVVGYTNLGAALQIGDTIKCSPQDPGELLQAGLFYREMDSIVKPDLRVIRATFRTTASLKKGDTVVLSVKQEEPNDPC